MKLNFYYGRLSGNVQLASVNIDLAVKNVGRDQIKNLVIINKFTGVSKDDLHSAIIQLMELSGGVYPSDLDNDYNRLAIRDDKIYFDDLAENTAIEVGYVRDNKLYLDSSDAYAVSLNSLFELQKQFGGRKTNPWILKDKEQLTLTELSRRTRLGRTARLGSKSEDKEIYEYAQMEYRRLDEEAELQSMKYELSQFSKSKAETTAEFAISTISKIDKRLNEIEAERNVYNHKWTEFVSSL